MIRALSIVAAVAALAVSAAPVSSPSTSNEAKAAAGVTEARAMHATTQLQMFTGDAYDNEMG
jgi:hypothetical protein